MIVFGINHEPIPGNIEKVFRMKKIVDVCAAISKKEKSLLLFVPQKSILIKDVTLRTLLKVH